MSTYSEKAKNVFGFLHKLSDENPKVADAFMKLHNSGLEDGALSHKQKELMCLSISIVIRCEGCIACHVQGSIKQGATKQEIIETIGVAVVMGGGPSIAYGEKAYEALKEMM
ncbi:MAG: carboxymuconolactone decarboxylase family protein [Paludibacteraceae bacterium]